MSRQSNAFLRDEELNWQYSLDDLDLFKDLSHLVNLGMNKIKENVADSDSFFFVLQSETHDYREIAREGKFSIPEDSNFITYLAIKNVIITRDDESIHKFFQEEEILNFLFTKEMHVHIFVPVVYRFRLMGFIAISLVRRKHHYLTKEEMKFIKLLKESLKVSLYAALLIDKRLYELLSLNEVAKKLEEFETYEEITTHVIDIIESIINLDRGIYYEYSEYDKKFFPRSYKNIDDPKTLLLGDGLSGFVFDKKKPVIISNIKENVFFNEINKEPFLVASVISIPFLSANKQFGVLTITRDKKNQEFSVDHLYLLKIIASVMVGVMENKVLYSQLEKSYFDTISALTSALEAKDKYTKGHSERVMIYSVGIAQELGLSADRIREIRFASILHDIGKIGISEGIITKPGRLTSDEIHVIQHHPEIGAGILSSINFLNRPSEYVKYHHEKLDGSGYYSKKQGEYPWEATIINLADSYDALTSNRPYRKATHPDLAIMELKKSIGKQYDARVFEAFVLHLKKSGVLRSNLPI